MNTLKQYIRETLLEGRTQPLPGDKMTSILSRLPQTLRDQFPSLGHPVTRGGETIQPFALKSLWTKQPPIVVQGEDEIIFGLHLGDSSRGLLPTEEEIKDVTQFMKDWLKKRGWYLHNSSLSARGETLRADIFPDTTEAINKTPTHLYHLTDRNSLHSILSQGLIPRGNTYSPRVYLFSDLNLLKNQADRNKAAHADPNGWDKPLTQTPDTVILQIDPSKLRRGTVLRRDPEFGGDTNALYTLTHIPPDAISLT